jgi:hypothetical protein
MKSEPLGTINIDPKNAKRLGLENLDPVQLQIISAMVTAKPVTSTEAAMTCLNIPIVQRSVQVVYIDSKPPNMWTHYVTKSRMFTIHSTVIYSHRHPDFENLPFKAYYNRFELVKERFITNCRIFVGFDDIRNYLYENTKVVRFTDYNPLGAIESFFYNVLLQYVPFRVEIELFSPANRIESYILECKLRGLLNDIDSLFHYVQEYSQRNLYDIDKQDHLVDMILERHPYLDPDYVRDAQRTCR